MDLGAVRSKVFAELNSLGFRPAKSLPPPTGSSRLRPVEEVASRLMALDALFTWVCFSEQEAPSKRVLGYIERNRLLEWLSDKETDIVSLDRPVANELHADTIGWRLENMWALSWVLGFDPEPSLVASQIEEEISESMIFDFLPGLDATVAQMVAKSTPRLSDEVVEMEYLFYCAHNAVRSAQMGDETVPQGFHPIVHGGAIHERRHSLTWCVTENVTWDDTDLST